MVFNHRFGGTQVQVVHNVASPGNHPACLPEKRRPHGTGSHSATDIELSGKCAKFHELLDNILAAGEKVRVIVGSKKLFRKWCPANHNLSAVERRKASEILEDVGLCNLKYILKPHGFV